MTQTEGSGPVRTRTDPATISTLVAWRRTGLVMSGGGLIALVAGLAVGAAGIEVPGLVAIALGFLSLVIGYGFLQRSWSDPLVAADPAVAGLKRWAGVAATGWGLALLVRLAVLVLPDALGWLRWVGFALGIAGVLGYLVVLVLAVRWHPARS